MNTWDIEKSKHIETPKKMVNFLNDIKEVCNKHKLSISHEDGHGSFIIEDICSSNIDWLFDAQKGY